MGTIARAGLLLAVATAPAAARDTQVQRPAPKIERAAEQRLRAMSDYLSRLQTLRVKSTAIDEVVQPDGGKTEIVSQSRVTLRRPDRLRSEQVGPGPRLAFAYDGRRAAVWCDADRTYGVIKAPPTIDATVDLVREKHGLDAPAADLLLANPYEVLTENAWDGRYVGLETVDGMAAHHLAFRQPEVDWQIWIQDGPRPVPLRYVITTKDVKNYPQYTVELTEWEPNAIVDDATFAFRPAPGARQLERLPSVCGTAGR